MTGEGKKKCSKGYSCGSSCINVTYQCHKDFPEGVSVSINGFRGVVLSNPQFKPQQSQEPQRYQAKILDAPEMTASFESDYPGATTMDKAYAAFRGRTTNDHIVRMSVETVDQDTNRPVTIRSEGPLPVADYNLIFSVDGDTDRNPNLPRIDALQSAKMLRNTLETLKERLEPGARLTMAAHGGDGHGDYRVRAYNRLGFISPAYKVGNSWVRPNPDGRELEGIWTGDRFVDAEEWERISGVTLNADG